MKQYLETDVHIVNEIQSEKNSGSDRKTGFRRTTKLARIFSQNWEGACRWAFFHRWRLGAVLSLGLSRQTQGREPHQGCRGCKQHKLADLFQHRHQLSNNTGKWPQEPPKMRYKTSHKHRAVHKNNVDNKTIHEMPQQNNNKIRTIEIKNNFFEKR